MNSNVDPIRPFLSQFEINIPLQAADNTQIRYDICKLAPQERQIF